MNATAAEIAVIHGIVDCLHEIVVCGVSDINIDARSDGGTTIVRIAVAIKCVAGADACRHRSYPEKVTEAALGSDDGGDGRIGEARQVRRIIVARPGGESRRLLVEVEGFLDGLEVGNDFGGLRASAGATVDYDRNRCQYRDHDNDDEQFNNCKAAPHHSANV